LYEDTTLSTDALLGWVLAVGIAVCGWLLAFWPFWGGGEAERQALAAFPQRIGAWSDDGDLAMIGLVAPFAPLLILPGAFGSTLTILGVAPARFAKPLISDQSWRVRCGLTGALAALVLFSALETRMTLGRHLGVAETAGVTWLKDGEVVERRPWTAARRIDTRCDVVRQRSTYPQSLKTRVGYAIAFDGHAPGDLSPGRNEAFPDWLARVAPLDARLRAAGIRSRGVDVDRRCIEALSASLTPPQADTLRGLLNAP
jgi:hypothetical protein